ERPIPRVAGDPVPGSRVVGVHFLAFGHALFHHKSPVADIRQFRRALAPDGLVHGNGAKVESVGHGGLAIGRWPRRAATVMTLRLSELGHARYTMKPQW